MWARVVWTDGSCRIRSIPRTSQQAATPRVATPRLGVPSPTNALSPGSATDDLDASGEAVRTALEGRLQDLRVASALWDVGDVRGTQRTRGRRRSRGTKTKEEEKKTKEEEKKTKEEETKTKEEGSRGRLHVGFAAFRSRPRTRCTGLFEGG